MKIGDTIKVDGVDLLILDEFEDSWFVLAYNLDMKSTFDEKSTNYSTSRLKEVTEQWFAKHNFEVVSREISLTSMSGEDNYGILNVDVAPLTFDEYRKYAQIIKPYIEKSFWTVTPWFLGTPFLVCRVNSDGSVTTYGYWDSIGYLPAFLLKK